MTSTAPAAATPAPTGPILVSLFSAAQKTHWELGVSLLLNTWQPLNDAVSASWGGPDSSDKRDWLCGAIADMFVDRPDTDEFDVEDTLVGAMEDEFEVAVDDGSGFDIGKKVMKLREQIAAGRFEEVQAMHKKFLEKPRNRFLVTPKVEEVDCDAGSSEDEEDGDQDEEMAEAGPVEPRERVPPVEKVVDEDGFELVQKKKGRR